ncbi:MAG: extracellular solute-binding protein [Rubrobacteraceae bacterium]|jgi:multiple sugar transport system substrate-binding protein
MKLRVLLVGGPMYDPLYARIGEFEEREGIEVEKVLSRGHPDLNERISHEFRSGTADYNLISTHTKYAPSQRQWLTPLDGDLEETASFSDRTLELARIDGAIYSVPRNLDVKLLHYRTDLLSAPPATWVELLETAASLKSENLHGFAFPGKESGLFGHFFELHAMYGGDMFEGDGPPVPRLDDEAGKAALVLLKELYEKAAPPETPDWHYEEVATCFRSGRAAMSTDWPGGFHVYEEEGSAITGKYDLAQYPKGPAGRFVYGGCHSFAIPKMARDRGAAVELLRFLTSRESQVFEARLGTLPARSDALEEARAEAQPGSLAGRRWGLLAEVREAAITPPRHPNYPAVEDAIWEGVREALIGNKTVEQALADTQEAARKAAIDGRTEEGASRNVPEESRRWH